MILLLMLALQTPQPKSGQAHDYFHSAPIIKSAPPDVFAPFDMEQLLGPARKISTPHLSETSALLTAHESMERDIGTQNSDIGALKQQVAHLEEQRANPDRVDIDDLKTARSRIEWTWGIIATVFTTLFACAIVLYRAYGALVWSDIIKPRLQKELASSPVTPSSPPSP